MFVALFWRYTFLREMFDQLQYEFNSELEDLVSSNTLIGDPILFFENIIVVPFFELIVGLGEGHFSVDFDLVGSGVEVKPKAFLILKDGKTDVLLVNNEKNLSGITEKILDVSI